uniref:Uncharacterized protein n=1 Tax=Aegilops tauschii subsp. strangulata TaxID=200361 RepID=A0A453PQB5_AEGTS
TAVRSLPPTSPPTPHDCSSLPPSPKPRARHREAEIPRSAAMPAPAALALAAALLLAAASICAEAVWLDMPQTGTKCVSEEIQANVVVLADYALMYESHPSSHPTLAVKVIHPCRLPVSCSIQIDSTVRRILFIYPGSIIWTNQVDYAVGFCVG